MTEERLIEIMQSDEIETKWEGDNTLQGFAILSKYIDPKLNILLTGASWDIIYGPYISDLISLGITEDEVIALRGLNWMLENESYFACFV